MRCQRRLDVVEGATHLFEEPGALEQVAELAAGWFAEHVDRLDGRDRGGANRAVSLEADRVAPAAAVGAAAPEDDVHVDQLEAVLLAGGQGQRRCLRG